MSERLYNGVGGFGRSKGVGSSDAILILQTALMDGSLVPLIGLYASFEIKHPR